MAEEATAEGNTLPQSDGSYSLVSSPVRTIGHYMKASTQVLDDMGQLQSFIDSEVQYGVNFAEEAQLLNGDGTGQNLLGIVTQASAYSAAFAITGETAFDRTLLAVLQVELNLYPCDAIVLNPTDWRKMQLTKDATGRYLGGGRFASTLPVVWNLPVVTSLAMTAGTFLCGAFSLGAQIFDRQQTSVQISTEDQDNFVRNLCTIKGTERIALAVKRPAAFVFGSLP
jgi:HK97 family phage major capsid protein